MTPKQREGWKSEIENTCEYSKTVLVLQHPKSSTSERHQDENGPASARKGDQTKQAQREYHAHQLSVLRCQEQHRYSVSDASVIFGKIWRSALVR